MIVKEFIFNRATPEDIEILKAFNAHPFYDVVCRLNADDKWLPEITWKVGWTFKVIKW